MSTKIDETPRELSKKNMSKKVTERVDKSSTETTDENSSKRKATHVWAAKDPWSGKPEEDPKNAKDQKPKNSSAKNELKAKKKLVGKEGKEKEPMRYLPKLMLEEDFENKTSLIKIGRHTSIRQVIQYALEKIKADWVITLNAFQLEISKALQATEIIKTRLSFLHQDNKLLSHTLPPDSKEDVEKPTDASRIRSGISITLARNQFDVSDMVGYQKPKPRTFLPQPNKKRIEVREEPKDVRPDSTEKKRRSGKTVNNRPRFSSAELRGEDTKSKPRKRS